MPKLGALSFFDFSSIEPRLFAYYAAKMGYPETAEMVKDGIDPYTAVARMIEQRDDITPAERQVWKREFLAVLYGAGVTRVAAVWLEETGKPITRAKARKMLDAVKDNLPGFADVQSTVQQVAARRGYIRGIDGRHLHPEPYGEHKLVNKLIQGSAAGIMKQALVRVHNWLKEAQYLPYRPRGDVDALPAAGTLELAAYQSRIISVVHDDLWIDGPVEELKLLNENIPRLMIHEKVNAVVPIEVEHQVTTTNAAEKRPYDEWRHA